MVQTRATSSPVSLLNGTYSKYAERIDQKVLLRMGTECMLTVTANGGIDAKYFNTSNNVADS